MSQRTISLFLAGLLLWSCGGPDFNPAPEAFGGLAQPVYKPLNTKQNGEACASGTECISGNCVDDVCCDSGCGGLCQHCALSGLEGNCRWVPAGDDPDGECPGDPPCGSQCDGSGGCAYATFGASCGSCAQCDGNGACNIFQPADSDPANVCGLCRVCPGDGPDCVMVARGADPWDECDAEPPDSCGQNGDCDGQGGCDLHPPGTVCQAELCTGGVHHPADLCDGLGNCIDSLTDLCLPYVCLDAVVCRSDCTGDQHCAGASHCEAPDCVAYLAQGEACSLDAACISDHCVDGFCCESACDGACEACDFAQNEGSCLPIADSEDPEDECAGIGLCGGVCDGQRACRFTPDTVKCAPCTSCDGAGACALLAQPGSDPYDDCASCWACSGTDSSCRLVTAGEDGPDDCPDTPESGCGSAGTCDGAGGCQLWPSGTVCLASSCTDGVLSPADLCDGLGNCVDSGDVDCNGYACLSDEACRTDCLADADCIPGLHCDNDACVADLQDGEDCLRTSQCISSNCIDGVCCADVCDGICQRCDLLGTRGTCTLVPAGQDPDGDCPGDGACGGACDDSGACAFPGNETACSPCARCDGSGNCSVWVAVNTDPGDACGVCRVCPGDGPDCTPVAAGDDVLEECTEQPQDSCGSDGACDGSGACRFWASGVLCGVQQCIGDTLSRAPACDGAGACLEQGSASCAPYICDGIDCAGPSGLHRITVEDAPGGTGSAIGPRALTTDDTLTLYAIGRDQSGGFLDDVLVKWSVVGEIGIIPPGPFRSTTFDPTRPGEGQVVATFHDPAVEVGASGILTISPGVAAGEIPLSADPGVLPADGASVATISGGPVQDADLNHVTDLTLVTLISSAGTLQGNDDDPGLPGLQRAVSGGLFSAELVAADRPARAVVKAVAVAPGTAQGEITVYFGDGRPVADAGEDQTVHAGQQVVLDGSASWDQQERPLDYAWRQTAGTPVTLAGVDTAAPTFAAPAVTDREDLSFELIVSVGAEQSDVDQTVVTVLGQEAGLPAPVIVLDPAEGPAPLQVLLDGSNSTAEEPAVLTNYLWTFSDGEAAVLGETASRTFAEPGGFGVQLTVTDDQGRFNFAQEQVSVLDGENRPPLLSVTALPERGAVPLEVLFTAQAVDPDGVVTAIEWDFGAGFALQGEQQTKTYHNPGFHKVRVRAQDDAGLYSSFEMSIAASDQGSYPPRILSTPPTQAATGQAYNYAPVAAGSPTFSWSLGKQVGDQLTRAPEGMLVDGVSGLITWTPKNKQAGSVDVTLVVQNDAGSDFQDFTIQVEGGSGDPSCGCGGLSRTNLPFLLILLVLFRRARALRALVRRPPPPAG
jgi:PKD repeat protein